VSERARECESKCSRGAAPRPLRFVALPAAACQPSAVTLVAQPAAAPGQPLYLHSCALTDLLHFRPTTLSTTPPGHIALFLLHAPASTSDRTVCNCLITTASLLLFLACPPVPLSSTINPFFLRRRSTCPSLAVLAPSDLNAVGRMPPSETIIEPAFGVNGWDAVWMRIFSAPNTLLLALHLEACGEKIKDIRGVPSSSLRWLQPRLCACLAKHAGHW